MNKFLFILLLYVTVVHSKHNDIEKHDTLEERNEEIISKETFVLEDYHKKKVNDPEIEGLHGQELVDYVNRRQDLWNAQFDTEFGSFNDKKNALNHVHNSIEAKKHTSSTRLLNITIPRNFDSRQNWPECSNIQSINDHGKYNSSWARTAVSVMSDRICIASEGDLQIKLSAVDLSSCCKKCEGNPYAAWRFFVKHGIVTASDQKTTNGCHRVTHGETFDQSFHSSKCIKECQVGYEKSYKYDKFYGKTSYSVAKNAEDIQKELMTHGPIQVSVEIFEDFFYYKYGIYFHQGGKLKMGHSVKLIGWGEDNGIPYWLVANSWGESWGEEGFFRILKGVDEIGIESSAVAGIPRIYYDEDTTLTPQEHSEMLKQIPAFCRQEAFIQINWEAQVVADSKWEIYDQEKNDNCYAAAAVALTQYSLYFNLNIRTKQLLEISTKEVFTCARCPPGKGNYNVAFAYIADAGISLDVSFNNCFDRNPLYKVTTPHWMPISDKKFVKAIMKHCLSVGPMAIAIYASPAFHAYKHGVMRHECKKTGAPETHDEVNHAVVAVGYTKDYLIIRNSFGSKWGENGFGRISLIEKNPFCIFDVQPANVTAIPQRSHTLRHLLPKSLNLMLNMLDF